MNFLIVSHVKHTQKDKSIYGYGPYVKEMNLWLKYVDNARVIAPMTPDEPNPIDLAYGHESLLFDAVPSFNLIGLRSKLITLMLMPYIFIKIMIAMAWADHIHLRCPGNMGLLGAIAQILFPWKEKTVKYAGNWDPKSKQPLSYRVQKWIVSNTLLSKNIKVLVYGKWPDQSQNIIEFFTASYLESEKIELSARNIDGEIKLVFVGALSAGKRPLIAVQTLHSLVKQGVEARLDLMGEGAQRELLENYIKENKLTSYVTLHGNQTADFVKEKLQSAHFLILMSQSEGWPKVVAEAMFWGCLPLTTNVSCVNYMIGEGNRGALVEANSESVVEAINSYMSKPGLYMQASLNAIQWSREFTLESFEDAIKEILNGK